MYRYSMNKNIFPKLVISQILQEYGIRMESSVLKMLVEEKMRYEIPDKRWAEIVQEISLVSGMIMED